jgi:putative membrane protein
MNVMVAVAVMVLGQLPGVGAKLSTEDQKILQSLHQHSGQLTELGKLAQTRASSPKVKSLANTVTKDQVVVDKLLSGYAAVNGVDLTQPPQDEAGTSTGKTTVSDALAQLKDMKGPAFDKLFTKTVADSQEEEISDVQAQQKQTKNEGLSALLGKVLPYLQKHKSQAETLLKVIEPKS